MLYQIICSDRISSRKESLWTWKNNTIVLQEIDIINAYLFKSCQIINRILSKF